MALKKLISYLVASFCFFRKKVRGVLSPVWLLDNSVHSQTEKLLSQIVNNNSNWLDVGCGLKPYLNCFINARYTGIDIEVSGRAEGLKTPDLYFDGVKIPFESKVFDGILCTQVLEHVEYVDWLLRECNRVLKLGGEFLISVPFVFREHEQPYDFRRYTYYGLRANLESVGFRLVSSYKCLSAIETVATIFAVYVANNLGMSSRVWRLLLALFITFPLLALSKSFSKILYDNGDLYCVLIIRAIKTKNLEDEDKNHF